MEKNLITYLDSNLRTNEIESKLLTELGLRNMLDLAVLQEIQDKLARVTNLAMVTVDLQGHPLTKETSFCEYCLARRQDERRKQSCFFSDAYGGLKASMIKEPYIYHCPAGLTDCAIPIIFNGQYMGTVVIGQVRTLGGDSLENLQNIIKVDPICQDDKEMVELYNKVPVMDLQKLKLTSDLIIFLIREMLEKQLLKLVQKEFQDTNQKLVYENFVQQVEIEELKSLERVQLKTELKPQMMISILNSVNNLSMVEGAELTNELICLFAETIRFSFQQNKEFVPLQMELDNIKRYLRIQQVCTGNDFTYDVKCECSTENKEILSLVLLPFVENAITHGILPSDKEKGKISIRISETNKEYFISISDNGKGLVQSEVADLLDDHLLMYENNRDYNGLSISNTRKRLVEHYGKEFDITIQSIENSGVTIILKFPMESTKVN